jgi:hypothetical protein
MHGHLRLLDDARDTAQPLPPDRPQWSVAASPHVNLAIRQAAMRCCAGNLPRFHRCNTSLLTRRRFGGQPRRGIGALRWARASRRLALGDSSLSTGRRFGKQRPPDRTPGGCARPDHRFYFCNSPTHTRRGFAVRLAPKASHRLSPSRRKSCRRARRLSSRGWARANR